MRLVASYASFVALALAPCAQGFQRKALQLAGRRFKRNLIGQSAPAPGSAPANPFVPAPAQELSASSTTPRYHDIKYFKVGILTFMNNFFDDTNFQNPSIVLQSILLEPLTPIRRKLPHWQP